MMEMNRRYIVYAMMATIVTLSSCAGEESEAEQSPPVPISVTVNSDHQPLTRNDETTPLTDDAIKITGFGLYCQPKSSTATYSPIMNNQKFTHNGSGWTYSPTKYWPNDNNTKLNFIAYAPYTTTDKVSYDNVATELTYHYIVKTDNPFDNIDLCTAVATDRTSSGGAVPLTFEHQTARLDVQVGITNATSGNKYFIKSVTINTNSLSPATLHVNCSQTTWIPITGASPITYNLNSLSYFKESIRDPEFTTVDEFNSTSLTGLTTTLQGIFQESKTLTVLPTWSSQDTFTITVNYVEYSVTGSDLITTNKTASGTVIILSYTGGHLHTLNIQIDPSSSAITIP